MLKDGKRDNSDGHISDKQYSHLKNVWEEFNFNTFRDFHNHYWKKDVLLLVDTDVLLLAGTFEKFIFTSLKNYNLDPCYYFSAPGLSWDAMLKMTKAELEKISDPNIHLFIKKGMRGGISYIAKRYSKANNEYCHDFDDKKLKNYIIYPDMNNLYGHAMSQYLPYGRFEWIKNTNEIVNRILNKKDNSLQGYFLEVDLDYPENLHIDHGDYPLAPKRIKIKREWLSPYCLEIANEYNIKTGIINKLTPNVMPKITTLFIIEIYNTIYQKD